MPQLPQIVIGLGTGRCGTQSLAMILSQQDRARVEHELHNSAIAWEGDEQRVGAYVRHCMAIRDLDLVGDVAFNYLSYVEHILTIAPHARFICLKRDRQATVKSYLTWTGRRNHWMRHDGSVWKLDGWDHCYPKYPATDKAEAIGLYWDDYYRRSEAFEAAYPKAFRVFSTEELNSEAGQHAMFDFLGLPGATRRVIYIHEHKSRPPLARSLLQWCKGLLRRAA